MLLDNINETSKKLTQLDKKEKAIQDIEKKIKNDTDYAETVSDVYSSMNEIKVAYEKLGYSLSGDSLSLIDDSLTKLEGTIDAGVVDEESLNSVKQQLSRKLNPALNREWKEFHSQKQSRAIGKLATIGSLVSDTDHIRTIRENITTSGDWKNLSDHVNGKTVLSRLCESISEVDKLEESLNLNDEVKKFISLVTQGRARITDLNETVLEWIKNENLEDKFAIKFR